MSARRRITALVAALLVLLHAVLPAVHVWQHAHPGSARAGERAVACSCGRLHAAPADAGGHARVVADPGVGGDHHCPVCELLRGGRDPMGAPPAALRAAAAPSVRLQLAVAPSWLPSPRAWSFAARAPPVLLV